MKKNITIAALVLTQFATAQEAWRSLLCVDPDMANSYFILDEAKCQNLNVARVDVDLVLHELQPNNTYTTTILQSITILPADRYGDLDMHLVPPRDPGDIASYRVRATDMNGIIVAEFDRTDGSQPREEICRHTCVSNSHAWALVAMADWQLSNTIIEIRDATYGGDYYRFYVPQNEMWGTGNFAQQYEPSEFCLYGGDDWTQIIANSPSDVYQTDEVPGDATSYLGYSLPVGTTLGYAVKKAKGPWCGLFVSTAELSGIGICSNPSNTAMMDHFNGDQAVQVAISQLDGNPGALTCQAALLSGGGPGWNEWGSGGTGQCTAFGNSDGSEDVDGDGNIDPVGWVSYMIDCPTTTPLIYELDGLAAVSSIIINRWDQQVPGPVLVIDMPNVQDPRLVPVERTQLDPGLYEYRVVFDDGVIWRKFQSYDQAVEVSANFASFTDVVVYPVPVDGTTFSVDFETLAPMDVDITVINNQGTVFYQKSDSFALAGRNKHVVAMQNMWPSGLYHVVIAYDDGSSESIGITVQ